MKPSTHETSSGKLAPVARKSTGRATAWALTRALLCTILMIEAILTAIGGRANGDMMVIVCPALGAVFLLIPAAQGWWDVAKLLRVPSSNQPQPPA